MRSIWALSLVLFVSACDPTHPSPDGSTSTEDAAVMGSPRLEVGTGEQEFEPFEDGDTVPLIRGPQGAQHVAVSVRVFELDPRGTVLDLRLTRDRDGMVVSQNFVVRVSLEPVEGSPGLAQAWGMTLVVPEPDQAIGEALTLRVQITERADAGGRVLEVERHLFTDWAPSEP
jgi:hypothetical protein